MKFLFKERGWGRSPSPRSGSSAPIQNGRPDFHFDFHPLKGMNREKVDQWPIEGFLEQQALETKGELLRRTLHPGDADAINASFSCEIFPNYNSKQSQCGVCPSCLVRRAALNSVGLPDSGKRYSFDAKSQILSSRKALGMIKMNRYAQRVASCFADSATPDAVLWEYPEAGSYFEEAAASLNMPFDEFVSKVRRMHHAFSLEWKEFADGLPSLKQAARLAA